MTRIVYKEKCLRCVFFIQKVCSEFHKLYMRQLVAVAMEQFSNDFIVESFFEDVGKFGDLVSQLL